MNDLADIALLQEALPPIPGPQSLDGPLEFEKSNDSPFPDKYSVQKERVFVRELIDAEDPDPMDPRYARFEELQLREQQLKQMESAYRLRSGADKVVPDKEAGRMRELGALEDDGTDSMTIHTSHAFRLFLGRSHDVNGKYAPMIGGARIASATKSLWYLSQNDNPYADWALLRTTQANNEILNTISTHVSGYEKRLEICATRGIEYSVLRSKEPKRVPLGFKSPYGHALVELIVQYDYFVRMVKTFIRKDLFSDKEGADIIRNVTRSCLRSFEETARFERYLMKEELRALRRSDFLPGADADAIKRTEAAKAIYGVVPGNIFTGAVAPRHTKRRVAITERDLAMLQAIVVEQEKALAAQAKDNDNQNLL